RTAEADYVAPRSDTERTLCAIWQEVLGIERIGITDNFFELGGHSLLAIQLASRIQSVLSLAMPLGVLFSNPTIAGIATSLNPAQVAFPNVRILANPVGKLSLFCFHSAYGLTNDYLHLSRAIADRYRVIGVESPIYADRSWRCESMSELARHYAEQICVVQPEGSINLLGWSFGGWLALEVASALEARERELAFVGVVDTRPHTSGGHVDLSLAAAHARIDAALSTPRYARYVSLPDREALTSLAAEIATFHRQVMSTYDSRAIVLSTKPIIWWTEATIKDDSTDPWQPLLPSGLKSMPPIAQTHEGVIEDKALATSLLAQLERLNC
ncbi:MAG TPA: thioesterase domain-containing protein, partial [Rhizobium sp.]